MTKGMIKSTAVLLLCLLCSCCTKTEPAWEDVIAGDE